MRLGDAFPSKYLKADDDIPEEGVDLTIREVRLELVGQGQKAEEKLVVEFEEEDKTLVCNKTNATAIAKVCGSDDTDDWVGRRITLYAKDVEYQGDMVRGIRVRLKAPGPKLQPRPSRRPEGHRSNRAPAPIPPANEGETGDDDESIPF